jgi:hypothetical protein
MGRRWLTVSTTLAAVALASTAAGVGDLPQPPGTGIWGKSSSGGQPGALATLVSQVPAAQPGIYSPSPPPGTTSSSTPSPAAPGQSSSPPNHGPITGYGPGGMRAAPGTPAAPPY